MALQRDLGSPEAVDARPGHDGLKESSGELLQKAPSAGPCQAAIGQCGESSN
jgi:hypothetical protein